MAKLFQSPQPQVQALYPHPSHLSVQLRHRIGTLQIDVDFKLTQPWTVLFGPSGSGKSTILHAIAGLLKPDTARIVSNPRSISKEKQGRVLVDTDKGIYLPSYQRKTPLASQNPALLPHMTVLQNIRFGYPWAGNPGEQEHLDDLNKTVPAIFRIEHLLDRHPGELSGGESQRVNLARTIMAKGRDVLLLDEPFVGLDGPLRDEIIANLLLLQQRSNARILSVTHDIAEAFQLQAEVIKIADGCVVQQGPVEVVLAEERRKLLAQLGSPA